MNRELRTLLILVVMALAGVFSLQYIAQRYARVLTEQTGTPARPGPPELSAQVEAFIAVRAALRAEIDAKPEGAEDAGALASWRAAALARADLPPERYARLRQQYRSWLAGRLPDGAWASAFDRRRVRLARVALGRYESLDR